MLRKPKVLQRKNTVQITWQLLKEKPHKLNIKNHRDQRSQKRCTHRNKQAVNQFGNTTGGCANPELQAWMKRETWRCWDLSVYGKYKEPRSWSTLCRKWIWQLSNNHHTYSNRKQVDSKFIVILFPLQIKTLYSIYLDLQSKNYSWNPSRFLQCQIRAHPPSNPVWLRIAAALLALKTPVVAVSPTSPLVIPARYKSSLS